MDRLSKTEQVRGLWDETNETGKNEKGQNTSGGQDTSFLYKRGRDF